MTTLTGSVTPDTPSLKFSESGEARIREIVREEIKLTKIFGVPEEKTVTVTRRQLLDALEQSFGHLNYERRVQFVKELGF